MSEQHSSPKSAESQKHVDRLLAVIARFTNQDSLALEKPGYCRFNLGSSYRGFIWPDNNGKDANLLVTVAKLPGGPLREKLLTDMLSANLSDEDGIGANLGLNAKTDNICINIKTPLETEDADLIFLLEGLTQEARRWAGIISDANTGNNGQSDLDRMAGQIRA